MILRIPIWLRVISVLLTLAVAGVIIYESSQARGEPGVMDLTTRQAYLGHFAIYAVLAFCAMMALSRHTLTGLLIVLAIAVTMGITLELYQAQVPSRAADRKDAIADAAGAVCGVVAYFMLATLALLFEGPKRVPAKR